MKILLTGAAGFLGSACRKVLQSAGMEVLTTDLTGNVNYPGDLTESRLVQSLPDVDTVVHCAAVQYVSKDLPLLNRSNYFFRNNVEATRRLVDRYCKHDVHFVNVGSSMMYKQCGAAIYKTTSVMEGQGVYSRSKLKAQRLVEDRMKCWATVIPCIIGGRGREGLFRNFVHSISTRRTAILPGSGNHPTSMVHVDDVASLITLIVQKRGQGFFNAAAANPLSIRQWIGEIACELKIDNVAIQRIPLMPLRLAVALSGYRLFAREQLLMLAQPHVLDVTESMALGWSPKYDNAEIIREITRYICEMTNNAPAK